MEIKEHPRRSTPAIRTFFVTKELSPVCHPGISDLGIPSNMFCYILLDGNTEGGWELCILKVMRNWGVRDVREQTSRPAHLTGGLSPLQHISALDSFFNEERIPLFAYGTLCIYVPAFPRKIPRHISLSQVFLLSSMYNCFLILPRGNYIYMYIPALNIPQT